jgi:hypothetical protein
MRDLLHKIVEEKNMDKKYLYNNDDEVHTL